MQLAADANHPATVPNKYTGVQYIVRGLFALVAQVLLASWRCLQHALGR